MNFMKKFRDLPIEEKIILFTLLTFILLSIGFLFELDAIRELLKKYGISGLFFVSVIGSTIFLVFPIEGVFPFFLAADIEPAIIVGIATIGSLIGTSINYGLGFVGSGIIEKKIDHEKMESARKMMNKYGWIGLFLVIAIPSPIPIPIDPITVLPGIMRMNYIEFIITVAAAKIAKFTLYVAIFLGIIGSLF